MKRLWIAASAVLVIIVLSLLSLNYTYNVTNELANQLGQIKVSVKQENTAQTIYLCNEYKASWDEKEKTLVKFMRHNPLDKITGMSARLSSLAEYADKSELMAVLDELIDSTHHLLEEETPRLDSIL
ncbi:MAG: DUF4363 family protein [Oscillospiraceae bacterium]